MVVDRGQSTKPERDYAFEKATWDLQAAPMFGIALLAIALAAAIGLIRRVAMWLTRAR